MRKLKLFFACLLMAVLSIGQMWADDPVASSTMSAIATANSWVTASGSGTQTCYTSFNLDANITISTSGSANCGSYWGSDWRLYQAQSGDVTITALNGCTLKDVTFTYTVKNTGTLKDGTTTISSGTKTSLSGTSKTFTVGNTASATNGQVKITAISVTYVAAAPSYTITAESNNTTYGTVSLTGSAITATRNPGYRYASPAYTVTSGTATVAQSGDAFTVTPSSDCTVRINFEPIPTHNIIFNNGVKVIDNAVVAEGASYAITEAVEDALIASCTYKHFEGWTLSSSIADASVKPALVNSIDMEGADVNLYAVYSVTSGGGSNVSEETASVTISEYATAHSWGSSSSAGQKEIVINSDITASLSSGSNTGKYYNDGWRTYQTESATLTISAADGCELTSATFTYTVSNTGALKDGTTSLTSGTAYEISGSSKSFTVGNSGSATNGQVRFTAISVNYEKTTTGTTTYSLEAECSSSTAHLTLIDIEGEHASSGDYTVGIPFYLPATAASCSKTFVGWDSDENCATEPTYAKGAEFTFNDENDVTLYAVYATAANTTAELNVASYASTNSWENGVAYSGFEIDGVTFTANGGANDGKYYSSDDSWRFYNGGSLSLSATGNILSVSSTPSLTFTIDGTSASYSFSATTKLTYITVTVEGSYSNYSTTCVEQLAEPTFTLAEGEYATTDKTVTIQAADGATIYYSTDGNDPTIDEGHLYNGSAIALNARGAYTIKAIAVKTGFENSDVAEAEYKINPPFESVADLFSYVGENTTYNLGQVTVTGYVSEIVTEYSSQHDNVSYNISDDGKTTSAQLQSYRGKGVKTGEDVYEDADLVAVGDKVTIIGTYKVFGSSNTKELDAGNYIITRVAKGAVTALAVSGTAAKTIYSSGDAFETTGLVATATYASGYAAEITPDSWAADPATVTATGNVAVTATVGSVTSPAYNVAVTVAAKTLVSIAVGTDSYNIYTSQALPHPTVTATYSEGEPEDVSASAVYDTENVFDTDTPDEYTITVSYTFGGETKTATYTVTVADYANADDAPYSVTEALSIITNVIGNTESAKEIVVAGTVSEENISNYKNRYKISDGANELLVYNGKGFNEEAFTNANYPKVGDVMIVKGKVINYYNNTPEFVTGKSYPLSQIRPATLAIEDVASFEVGADDMEVANLTIDKVGNGVVTLVSSSNTAFVEIVEGKLHAVAPGTATITANLAATENVDALNYAAASTTFNVTVIAAITKYAITFDANGGEGDAPAAIADQAENAEVPLPANTWTKDGYTFNGWKVINNSTSAEVPVAEGKFSMPASAVTIQATWAEISAWAYVYDNNVVVAHTGSGTDDGTITISETAYKLVKAGASSNTGTIKVTVPAGATDLHFHAFAWGGKTAKIQIAGVDNPSISEFDLAGEAGAAGSGNDFTLQGVPVDQYFHVSFDAVADETEIVFSKATGSADNRFFFYGVNQVGGDFGSYQRSGLTAGNYATICLPNGGTIEGAKLFDLEYFDGANTLYLLEVNGNAMEAGKPYIFLPSATTIEVTYTNNFNASAGDFNGLVGSYTQKTVTANAGNYILYQNAYYLVNSEAYVGANRAYIHMEDVPDQPTPQIGAAPRRRVGMSVHGEQTTTGIDALNAVEAPVKVMINGQIFILRGEKMYDATGRMVK